MAIKGRSKSRGAKVVARGPKPAYTPVKTPLFRRRGLWIAIASVLGTAAIFGLFFGFVQERNDSRDADLLAKMAASVNRYRGEIEPILSSVGSAVPPSSFNPMPDLATAIASLEGDDVEQAAVDQAGAAAEQAASSARNAGGLFDDVDATKIVRDQGFSREFILYVINSRDGFSRAMGLYRQAALLVSLAAKQEAGPLRDDLVARAGAVYDLAAQGFGAAYQDYVEAQVEAGVFQATNSGIPITGPTGLQITGATG